MKTKRLDWWMAAAVLAHLVVTLAHGRAHDGGHVALGAAGYAFVLTVIVAGPLAGLALSLIQRRAGAIVVASTMAGALVFGVVNHFVFISPDHVSQVADEWRPLFTATAWLLVVSEVAGLATALRASARPLEELS